MFGWRVACKKMPPLPAFMLVAVRLVVFVRRCGLVALLVVGGVLFYFFSHLIVTLVLNWGFTPFNG